MKNSIEAIKLVPYDPSWPFKYALEAAKIQQILGSNCVRIHHIGSTAIPGIYAKPIIDIFPVVDNLNAVDQCNADFEQLGYICRGEYGYPGRRYFKKIAKEQSFHIHAFQTGDTEIERHLAFKERLTTHPDEAASYSWIKRCLAEQFPFDRQQYTDGKDSFIRMINYRAGVVKPDQLEAQDNIVLTPPNPNWLKLGEAEINALQKIINLPYAAMQHLGSTAVPDLLAKPTIDIFIALDSIDQAAQWIKPLINMGYDYWAENPDKMHLRFFKGMPPYGIGRTHHVHILPAGEDFNRRVQFKNTLCTNEKIRREYEKLKRDLVQQNCSDREAYTDAKKSFVNCWIKK